ncbi:hypothetical protein T4B_11862 [Trichinella pseudospiralis]|uniref:Uncharacterized protein n=1 Tax=Trichinella pseudospiralis TaxID=6337 RepID=A0A0V1K3W7_TRIPS|nr:hypothetical protein T4A_7523 [Trichinella pseudospiralis]KRZ21731.1 hypothetical protein T4B_11862 [Trichinella pseudospiralis]KRZ41752.1 hypothetical protein T4C_1462 [Trichinella pseudospiralis]
MKSVGKHKAVHTCAGYLMISQIGRVQSQNAFCQVQIPRLCRMINNSVRQFLVCPFHRSNQVHIRRCLSIGNRMASSRLNTVFTRNLFTVSSEMFSEATKICRNDEILRIVSHCPGMVVILGNGSVSTAAGRKYGNTPGISSAVILSVTVNISNELQALNSKNP